MTTLYRKYRPQKFADIKGQEHIRHTLENELKRGTTAHAYLFYGPRGTGKTSMARLLAKAANCTNRAEGESEPCNTCQSCTEIMSGASLDVVEIDAASNTGVDNVRENIIASARFAPNSSKHKIYIIDEVHMLSTSAFNALLKIIEEPPAHVMFILATTEIHKIIPTIISRCQRFDFQKIPSVGLREKILHIAADEGRQIDDDVVNLVIKNSDGCLRDAESLLGQIISVTGEHITLDDAKIVMPVSQFSLVDELLTALVAKDGTASLDMVRQLIEKGYHVEQYVHDIVEFLRKVLLFSLHHNFLDFEHELDEVQKERLAFYAQSWEIEHIVRIIEFFSKAAVDTKKAIILTLPLELAIVRAIHGDERQVVYKDAPVQYVQAQAAPQVSGTVSLQQSAPSATDTSSAAPSAEQGPEITHASSGGALSEQFIKDQWIQVVKTLRKDNYTLSCILSAGQVLGSHENEVTIGFRHEFNIKKFSEIENKRALEEVMDIVYGQKMVVTFKHSDNVTEHARVNDVKLSDVRRQNMIKANPYAAAAAAKQDDPASVESSPAVAEQSSAPTGQAGIDTVLSVL